MRQSFGSARSASVNFRLSKGSLFVTYFAGKFKGLYTKYRRQNTGEQSWIKINEIREISVNLC
jgi:hypothetical protein